MVEDLLPPTVAVTATRTDPPEAELFAEEQAEVARAVAKRRAEFTTVRHCARAALATLGLPPAPILRGERGAPIWPAGIVGSMTHCAGYRAAAVARATDLRSIGIDAEPNEEMPEGVLDAVSLPAERDWIAAHLAERPTVRWDRLLFSAKESVYKAWYPLTGRWLDFAEAEITPAGEGRFVARLLVPGPVVDGSPLSSFTGRWSARAGLVATAVTV
ncbi:4'-phosphopantetheinyl transferase [Micromonospora sp. NPDC048898]|uniref:4'-phosphopantetheinyl transferase family protein n=1 Tax=Micromonospora sp. NPDC048898 TaxID=3364260 RepID=UPI00372131CE